MPTEKNIPTSEILYEHFKKYVKACKENFKKENVYNYKVDKQVGIEREIPLTWAGFEIWLRKNKIICKLDDYKANNHPTVDYSEYSDIIRAIGQEIYEDKFTGAVAGIFNPNIIARDLGLTDKKDLTSSDGTMATKPTIVVSDEKTAEELKKLIDKDNP